MTQLYHAHVACGGDALTTEQHYFADLAQVPDLSEQEYQDLARCIVLYRQGLVDAQTGRAAEERMIEAHLPLVVSIARSMLRQSCFLSLADLIQEGNLALITLVRSQYPFDASKGTLRQYACKALRSEMLAALYQQDPSLPVPQTTLSHALSTNLTRANHLYQFRRPLRLDRPLRFGDEESETTLLDLLAAPASESQPQREADQARKARLVEVLLSCLPSEQERRVLRLRYGLEDGTVPRSWEEVAQQVGLARDSSAYSVEVRIARRFQTVLADAHASGRRVLSTTDAAFVEGAIAFLEQPDCPARGRIDDRIAHLRQLGLAQRQRTHERLTRAYDTLLARGEVITGTRLAQEAGCSRNVARRYLREQPPDDAQAREAVQQEVREAARRARLDRAYATLSAQGRPITRDLLAETARVDIRAAMAYLCTQHADFAQQRKAAWQAGRRARLDQAYSTLRAQEQPISGILLARTAHVASDVAQGYLREQLDRASASLSKRGLAITWTALANTVRVGRGAATAYLRARQAEVSARPRDLAVLQHALGQVPNDHGEAALGMPQRAARREVQA